MEATSRYGIAVDWDAGDAKSQPKIIITYIIIIIVIIIIICFSRTNFDNCNPDADVNYVLPW